MNKKEIKNKDHSRMLLSGISTLEKTKAAGTPDTDTRGWNNIKAFTLIELLVVVLIIGILSAIALPQYQKAVQKARITEAIVALKAITDAQEVYFMANNEYTDDLSELDVQVNPDGKYYTYSCFEKRSCYASAKQADLPYLEFHLRQSTRAGASSYLGKHWCLTKDICKNFGSIDPDMGSPYYLINF